MYWEYIVSDFSCAALETVLRWCEGSGYMAEAANGRCPPLRGAVGTWAEFYIAGRIWTTTLRSWRRRSAVSWPLNARSVRRK